MQLSYYYYNMPISVLVYLLSKINIPIVLDVESDVLD